MKFLIFSILACGVGGLAHAQSYFDDLKKAYSTSCEKIKAADIDDVDTENPKTCVSVYASAPEQEVPTYLRKFSIQKPGDGPLLPPKTIVKVLYSEINPPNVHGTCESVDTTFKANEVDSAEGLGTVFDVRVRKYEKYVVYAVMRPGIKSPLAYGYCF